MNLVRRMYFLVAITLPVSVLAQAQTIADAARQERERRKAIENQASESIPVFTSVTPAPTAGSTVTTNVKTTTVNETAKSNGPTDLQGHDEKYWRQKFDEARLAVKNAEDHLKLLDLRASNSIPMRRSSAIATYERDVFSKDLADAQQKLADLEDQLRRSGGFPGWSRPR